MAETKLNFKPIGGYILIKPKKAEEVTKSGIFLPDSGKDKPQEGTIVALGAGKLDSSGKQVAFNVKVGDSVYFKKYAPTEIEVEGEEYFILEEESILGIIG